MMEEDDAVKFANEKNEEELARSEGMVTRGSKYYLSTINQGGEGAVMQGKQGKKAVRCYVNPMNHEFSDEPQCEEYVTTQT